MRDQRYKGKIAACLAALVLSLSAAGIPGFAAAGSSSAGSSETPVSFSTGVLTRSEGGASGTAARTNSAYQAIRKISSSANVQQLRRVSLSNSLAEDSEARYAYVEQKYGYSALTTDTERTLYDYIGNAAYQVSNQSIDGYYPVGQIMMPTQLDQSELQKVFLAYTNDHPEVFWLSNVFSYGSEGNFSILQLYSVLSADACNSDIDTLQSKVEQVVNSIPAGLSEFDREEALYNYMVKQCSYDTAAVKDSSIWQAFTAYGALTDGKVVCEGYSRAMELLSSYEGLHCALIRGSSGGVGHMWNAVSVAGNWYYLDLTWSDGNQPVYNYFNITTQVIGTTHKIAPLASTLTSKQFVAANSQVNLFLPSCTATAENYYIVKGIRITDLSSANDSAVVSQLSSDLANSDTTIAFYINAGSKYSSVISGLVSASPYKMKSYLQQAQQRAGKKVTGASYVVDSANHGLDICVTY